MRSPVIRFFFILPILFTGCTYYPESIAPQKSGDTLLEIEGTWVSTNVPIRFPTVNQKKKPRIVISRVPGSPAIFDIEFDGRHGRATTFKKNSLSFAELSSDQPDAISRPLFPNLRAHTLIRFELSGDRLHVAPCSVSNTTRQHYRDSAGNVWFVGRADDVWRSLDVPDVSTKSQWLSFQRKNISSKVQE